MTAQLAAALYTALVELDYNEAIAFAHAFEDEASPEVFDEYLTLVEREDYVSHNDLGGATYKLT